MKFRFSSHTSVIAALAALVLAPMLATPFAGLVQAAKSSGCEGGGYRLVNLSTNAAVTSGDVTTTVSAASFAGNSRFDVRGLYTEFDVGLADFAVFNYTFTGAPNPLDMTGGVRLSVRV